jgi:hypothetical protein
MKQTMIAREYVKARRGLVHKQRPITPLFAVAQECYSSSSMGPGVVWHDPVADELEQRRQWEEEQYLNQQYSEDEYHEGPGNPARIEYDPINYIEGAMIMDRKFSLGYLLNYEDGAGIEHCWHLERAHPDKVKINIGKLELKVSDVPKTVKYLKGTITTPDKVLTVIGLRVTPSEDMFELQSSNILGGGFGQKVNGVIAKAITESFDKGTSLPDLSSLPSIDIKLSVLKATRSRQKKGVTMLWYR